MLRGVRRTRSITASRASASELCSGGKSGLPPAALLDIQGSNSVVLPVMVPRVDGIGDAGLQEPFLSDLVPGPTVVDLQEQRRVPARMACRGAFGRRREYVVQRR